MRHRERKKVDAPTATQLHALADDQPALTSVSRRPRQGKETSRQRGSDPAARRPSAGTMVARVGCTPRRGARHQQRDVVKDSLTRSRKAQTPRRYTGVVKLGHRHVTAPRWRSRLVDYKLEQDASATADAPNSVSRASVWHDEGKAPRRRPLQQTCSYGCEETLAEQASTAEAAIPRVAATPASASARRRPRADGSEGNADSGARRDRSRRRHDEVSPRSRMPPIARKRFTCSEKL